MAPQFPLYHDGWLPFGEEGLQKTALSPVHLSQAQHTERNKTLNHNPIPPRSTRSERALFMPRVSGIAFCLCIISLFAYMWTNSLGLTKLRVLVRSTDHLSTSRSSAAPRFDGEAPLVTHVAISAEAPVVEDGRVLWHDDRAGPTDIWGYEIATGREIQVTLNDKAQLHPDLFENLVVYEDNRNDSKEQKNGWDIFAYDLETGFESILVQGPHHQRYPRVWSDYLVYQDEGTDFKKSDVHLLQISTGVVTPLAVADGFQGRPDIDSGWVVWADQRNGGAQIGIYQIATGETRFHSARCYEPCRPRLHGHEVVWSDSRNGNHDIFLLDLESGAESTLYAGPGDQLYPVLSNSLAAWQEHSPNHHWDIFALERATGVHFPVTHTSSRQSHPALDGNLIVWQDNRSHTWDIYAFEWQGSIPDSPVNTLSSPADLSVGAGPNSTLLLSWQYEAAAEHFVIQRAQGIFSTDWQDLTTVPGTQRNYVDANVQLGQSYWYRVRAATAAEQSGHSNESYSTVVDGALSADERYLHVLINEARMDPASWGYPEVAAVNPVGWDPLLALSVQSHAVGMNNSHCCQGHIDLEGRGAGDRARASGYEYSASENLFVGKTGTAGMEDVHRGFMESEGHRNNLMDPNARVLGVGFAAGGRGTVVEAFSGGAPEYQPPALPSGAVTPGVGAASTLYDFVATFWNAEKAPPTRAEVIIDGTAHAMTLRSGTAGAGTYTFSTALPIGSHSYYFEFAWGAGQLARLPQVDAFSGPNVSADAAELSADRLHQVHPTAAHNGWLTGDVSNLGQVVAQNVLVHFYAGHPAHGGQLLGESGLALLEPQASAQVKIRWKPVAAGTMPIYMVIDPRGEIAEADEKNNVVSASMNICEDTAAIWYVDAAAPGLGDGRTRQAAVQTLQQAVQQARAGHTILVAAGSYTGGIEVPPDVQLMGAGWEATTVEAPAVGSIVMLSEGSQISGFTLRGASAETWDAGVWIPPEVSATVTHNRFESNSKGVANPCFGCTEPCAGSSTITNNLFTRNRDKAIDTHCPVKIVNNTVAFNGTGIYLKARDTLLRNNIVVDNESYGLHVEGAGVIAAYNNVWRNGTDYGGGPIGEEMLSGDPGFVNAEGGDFHLRPGSICIDAGDPDAAYMDADGSRNDMGAYGGSAFATPTAPAETPTASPPPGPTATPAPNPTLPINSKARVLLPIMRR